MIVRVSRHFFPMLRHIQNSGVPFEGSEASPACLSDKITILKKMDLDNWNRGKAEVLEEKPVPVPRTDALEDSACTS